MITKKAFKLGASVCVKAPAGSAFPIVDPDIYKSIDWLYDNDFDSIEVHIPSPDLVDSGRLKEYIQSKGMCASSIGTGLAVAYEQLVMTSKDREIRRRAIERLMRQCDLGAQLDCPVVIGSMRGKVEPGDTYGEVDRRMVESSKILMEYADSLGVDVVVEAIDRSETNYLRTAEEVLELIDKVGSSHLKVHLDTFHMNIEELDWEKPVLACGEKLGHVHVADNTRLYPGSGMIDFMPFLKALKKVNYSRSLVFEIYPGEDGYKSCILGRDYLLDCFAKLDKE
ncbi:MAG: sugar phosphate isomerase/epimerase [Clostridium sp.]|nr:sugar phosphate isomerase/epimerase [Clostridium sp.]